MSLLYLLSIIALAALHPLALAWSDEHMQFSNVGLKRAGFAGDVDVNAGRCLEMVPGSNNGQSADARLWACRGRFDEHYLHQQVWRTGWDDIEVVAIKRDGVDYCLDVEGGHAFAGARVRLFQCNWTRAQYWRAWANDKGRYRSHLDMNLCLDPAGGWNGDRNGQNLMLWHCHDGGEQEFAARPTGEFRTNLLWDMAKDCHSNDAFFCSFGCAGAGSETLVNVIFEGVKLACGWAKHPPVALACVSAAVVTQDTLPDWKDKCKCRCERWRQPPRPGPWANRTRPVLESRPLVTAVPEGSQHVELTIDGNVSRVISMTELVKENPHLKTLVVPAASPVLTHTVNVTATA